MSVTGWRGVPCPTCQAKTGKPCRSVTTGRSNTDTHVTRRDAVTAATCAELQRYVDEAEATAQPAYDHLPCCTACDGTGLREGEPGGLCWDCVGTGHPHPPVNETSKP